MNTMFEQVNSIGKAFVDFAWPMLIQSSVLIVLLLGLDIIVHRRIRAAFRYWMWMIVLVKLALPTTLSSPTSPAYWFGDELRSFVTGKLFTTEKPRAMSPVSGIPLETSALSESTTAASSSSDATVEPTPVATAEADKAAAPAMPAPSITWQGFVFLTWLIAVVTMMVLLIQRTFFVRRLTAQSQKPSDAMLDALQRACEQIGIKRRIALGLSAATAAPSVCGLFEPTILIPQSLPGKINTQHLKSILLHELAHIKRGDLWVSFIQTIAQIIYIYNPLLWVANAIIRKVREQAADEMVLAALGKEADDYPKTLLNVSRLTFGSPVLSLRLIGVAESKKALHRRIRHMLNRPIPKSARVGVLGTIVIIIIAAVLLPMAKAEKSEKADIPTTRDVIIDPNTGLQFHKVESLAGEKDTAYFWSATTSAATSAILSPNRRFALPLLGTQVMPLEGGKPFNLIDFRGHRFSWSPDGRNIAFSRVTDESIWIVPVSPETAKPTGPARKLIEGDDCSTGVVTWSPDSRAFAYGSPDGHLWTFSLEDSSKRQITDKPVFSGSWSPDGKWIACRWYDERYELWVCLVPSAGGPLRRLCKSKENGPMRRGWSPDSKWFFYHSKRRLHFVRIADSLQVDVNLPKEVGEYLSWSPDRKKMWLYEPSYDWKISLKIVPVSGGAILDPLKERLYSGVGQYWSPDSKFVATWDWKRYWVVPVPGGEPFPLELNMETEEDKLWQASLSPDCKKLLFVPQKGERWVVPVSIEHGKATGEPVKVFDKPKIEGCTWSPDGSKLAVICDGDIWIAHANGSPPFRLTETPQRELAPEWSPDGKRITWISYTRSTKKMILYVCDLAGGKPSKLVDVAGAFGFRRSNDQTKVAYMLREGKKTTLWTVTVPAGEPKKLMEIEQNRRVRLKYDWSPNGQQLAVVLRGKVSVFSLPDGEPREIADFSGQGLDRCSGIRWSPSGQTLALVLFPKPEVAPSEWELRSDSRIFVVPARGGEWTELAADDTGGKYGFGLEWSPDAKWIAYASDRYPRTRPEGVIWEVEIDPFLKRAVEKATVGSNTRKD